MLDLGVLARRLRVQGCSLWLRAPQPQVRRVIELVWLHRLPGVLLEGPSPALT
jgi:anti-anti-sigma regulatory factor